MVASRRYRAVTAGGVDGVVVPLPLPPEVRFDPHSACQRTLDDYGFPARPDPATEPGPYALWAACFGTATRYLHPRLLPLPDARSHADDGLGSGGLMTNWLTSQNWSGFIMAPAAATQLAGVAGCWTVPAELRRPATAPLHGVWRFSSWVGLDGSERYAQGLPQIGTDHSLEAIDGTVQSRAWVQWYADPAGGQAHGYGPTWIENFAVALGDTIAGFVTVEGPNLCRFALVNLSRPQPVAVLLLLDTGSQPDAARYRILGCSAEWILERPEVLPIPAPPPNPFVPAPAVAPTTAAFYPLPDFGAMGFRACSVQGVASLDAPSPRRFAPAAAVTQISMYQRDPHPARIVTLTRPRIGTTGGEVLYVPRTKGD